MADVKTRPTRASVQAFIRDVKDNVRRQECRVLLKLLKQVTRAKPEMWGASMIGFGSYHYRYASGREGDWFLVGFSPRKQDLSVYIMAGFGRYGALMRRLGKHKTGKCCLYIKRLSDIDLKVLQQLVRKSVAHMKRVHA